MTLHSTTIMEIRHTADFIERAWQTMLANAPEPGEDPDRPVYHFLPPSGAFNDIDGSILYGGYMRTVCSSSGERGLRRSASHRHLPVT